MVMIWPFDNLQCGHYGAIYADPPWLFKIWGEAKGASRDPKYECAGVADLMKLPVADLAQDNCCLFMWVTWPLLLDGIALMKEWEFEYKTCAFSWIKADNKQPSLFLDDIPTQVGLGYWTRANSEVCLLGTRGSPKRLNADVRQAIIEPRRQHSRKPDCVPERIERLVAGPYCELFARTTRPGWSCWGNQTEKFRAAG